MFVGQLFAKQNLELPLDRDGRLRSHKLRVEAPVKKTMALFLRHADLSGGPVETCPSSHAR